MVILTVSCSVVSCRVVSVMFCSVSFFFFFLNLLRFSHFGPAGLSVGYTLHTAVVECRVVGYTRAPYTYVYIRTLRRNRRYQGVTHTS